MTFDKNYIAVITGACGGIGEAVSRALADQGLTLALLDNRKDMLSALVSELNDSYSQPILGYAVDIADATQVENSFTSIATQLGLIGYLINSAGFLHYASVADTDIHTWEKSFSTNATGVFNVSRVASRYMVEQRKGSIVTVASNAARVPRSMMAAYCASKAAAQAFTYALGLEVAPFGVRCNVVSPGSTDTPMLRSIWEHSRGGAKQTLAGDPENFRIGIPLNKIATPKEIAAAICFYLCDESGQTTLSTLLVDGGAALGNC